MLRILIMTLFLLIYCSLHAHAFDLDMTVDDDIRKNYNSSKLINDTNTYETEILPELPERLKKETIDYKQSTKKESFSNENHQIRKNIGSTVKIPRGTSIDAVNCSKISDWQSRGTVLKFKTQKTICKKRYIIPANTVFTGEILESHQPQITGNGGLVVIRIRSMSYGGQTYPINGYITRADDKIIFLNNIKGERKYLKTVWKKGNWGRTLFNRMLTLTVNLGSDGSTFVLSPFPFVYGTLCLGANTIISPVTAFFSKGGHVLISSGKYFRIKLTEDALID